MNNAFKDFVMPPLVLTIICAVVTVSLVGTYNMTKPIIDAQAQAAADAARAEVLPGATSFTKLDIAEMPEGGIDAYQSDDGAGYVITGSAKGYGGLLQVVVGIKEDGTIAGAKVLSHNETSGLGSRCAEPEYMAQYVGKDMNLEGIEFLGGCTVSSKAVNKAVGAAYAVYGQAAGVEIPDANGPVREPLADAVKTELFPEVTSFQKLMVDGEAYKAGDAGYIVVVSEDGFIGPVTSAVAFDTEGKILKVVSTENTETEGFGQKLAQPEYLDTLVGVSSIDGVEKVAGATITSEAFVKSMTSAFELYPSLAAAGGEYVGEAEGFGGKFTVSVGIDDNGVITAVKMGKHDETDGFGAKCAEESFTSTFVGKTSADEVEGIAGATITSTAFKQAVTQALEEFAAQKGA